MKAQIKTALEESSSKYNNGKFFVLKVKTEDGEYYDIVPSEDCRTYNAWKIISKDIDSWYDGFRYLMEKNGKKFFNKKVLPIKVNN